MKTKDGIEVKIGQVWRDLDKRTNGRTIKVLGFDGDRILASGPRKPKISISRMHRHSTGFELVEDVK